jgi:hypothetical protein
MTTTPQMPTHQLGGAVSIGSEQEEDQEPFPDGEELPEDDDVAEEKREPEAVPDEIAEGRA